ncbi:MAG TPA: chemotaxis protein CheC [Spirochaetia bacterium]|nr:chemotaxis protein CheC [Spirochaetia bacterium]
MIGLKQNDVSLQALDALREVGNIGMGNAATSLAQLMNVRIDMSVPRAALLSFDDIVEMSGGMEEVVSCVYMKVLGDAPGTVLYIFDEKSTYHLLDTMLETSGATEQMMTPLAESAIKEIGNVLTGSFISAIASLTGLRMITTVPLFSFDMLGAVLSSSLIESGYTEKEVLIIDTAFFQGRQQINGHFFLFADPGSLETMLYSLGISA